MMHTGKEDAVSPVIGVILIVAITVILTAVIAASVFGMDGSKEVMKPCYNISDQCQAASCEGGIVTKNIIVADTDMGSMLISIPYTIISTEPFKYETNQENYLYATNRRFENVTIVYTKHCRDNKEVREIVAIKATCDPCKKCCCQE